MKRNSRLFAGDKVKIYLQFQDHRCHSGILTVTRDTIDHAEAQVQLQNESGDKFSALRYEVRRLTNSELPKCATMDAIALAAAETAPPKPYWSGKLHHSRTYRDDWGFIRDEWGMLVIKVPLFISDDEAAKHRREGTDPTQPMVDYLLYALNSEAARTASAGQTPRAEQVANADR